MSFDRRALPHGVRTVASFDELVSARFTGDVNAFCWQRALPGAFHQIVDRLATGEGVTPVDEDDLRALSLGAGAAVARGVLIADLALLRDAGLAPELDCIRGYASDDTAQPVPTDVYSFHVDRADVAADTYLCTYAGASSEGLPNEMAIRRVDVPETRARLLRAYGGADDAGFAAYLSEHCFDLHYAATTAARPYTFGVGNLWRIAIAWPGSPVLPCIHRAPRTPPDAPARLLLIG